VKWPWRNPGPERCWEPLLWSPLALPAWGYALGARADRAWRTRGALRPVRVDARVLSVGALTAGGAGKTPLAAWLAHHLRERGNRVALLTRGYRRRAGAPVTIASDGRSLRASAEEVGDEAHLLACHAPGVPVLVAADRVQAARRAIALYGAELLVLDDGFQHHALARDLDLVAIDTNFGLGNGWRLPRGPLREALPALKRAHAVAFIGGPPEAGLAGQIAGAAGDAVFRIQAERVPHALRAHGRELEVDPGVLRGMRVGMLAGIARPASLRATLEGLGAEVIAERGFRDHHRYRARDFRRLAEQAEVWVTTEKDAGKIHPDWVRSIDLRVLGIRMRVESARDVLGWIEGRLGVRAPG